MKRFVIEKVEGETPLEAIERARALKGIGTSVPLTYAGRLDPMASGTLLVLVGDECKRARQYHGLDKEYVFEILFGFRTDTGDILGIPEACGVQHNLDNARLTKAIEGLAGPISLPYPRFSSKTVGGKPLFLWTLEGRLNEVEIPTADTVIYAIRHQSTRAIAYQDLKADILRRIALPTPVTAESKRLGADFRRNDIIPAWERLLEGDGSATLTSYKVTVSSGTYIRSLAPYIGERLGTYGLAYSIRRTKIGRYFPLPFLHGGAWIKRF